MTELSTSTDHSGPEEESTTLLRSFSVRNYKSLVGVELELGRLNVFIGENGCGKSNLLESFGMAAAGLSHRLTDEDLYIRGIRLARPSLVRSAFPDSSPTEVIVYTITSEEIEDRLFFLLEETKGRWKYIEAFDEAKSILVEREAKTSEKVAADRELRELLDQALKLPTEHSDPSTALYLSTIRSNVLSRLSGGTVEQNLLAYRFSDFGIYSLNTLILRGLQVESRREPLGLYGEGLDVLIAQMSEGEREKLTEYARLVSWVDGLEIDTEGARKLQGYKPGRSRSELYFHDRFMAEENRTFSAENANEGILHVLFYLALFMSQRTPRLFAIDNIETALNPRLLRHLIKQLAGMAKEHGKQALITTHNPAALDGLNLNDDDQRLFEVYRNDEGHTQVRRIKVKPEHAGEKLKLSEMWMRGMLGAVPTHF